MGSKQFRPDYRYSRNIASNTLARRARLIYRMLLSYDDNPAVQPGRGVP
jgi:hypothetical protein